VITGLFFSAVITLVVSLVDFAQLGGILHWLMGSLGIVGYRAVGGDRRRQPWSGRR
jgi:ABC-type Fe3+-siderophore transport system permease subunit